MAPSSKKIILFVSNRFGYGPTITLTHVMRQFAERTQCKLIFAGSGICMEAFVRQNFDSNILSIPLDERNIGEIRNLITTFDASNLCVVSCLNKLAIQAAHEKGIPNALIDPLTWMWSAIPDGYLLADYYFSNHFSAKNMLPQMTEVPLILGPVPSRQNLPKEYFLFNIGGVQNHLAPGVPKNYLLLLARILNKIHVPHGLQTVVAGGQDAIDFLKIHITRPEFRIESLSSQDYLSVQQRSRMIVSLAGAHSTFMSFAIGLPVVFLLPQLLSQWKLADFLEDRGYIAHAPKWAEYLEFGEQVDQLTEKESILLTERLSSEVLNHLEKMERITADIQTLIDMEIDIAGQSRFVSDVCVGGEKTICECLCKAWNIS